MKTQQEIFNSVWNYFIVEQHPQAVGPRPNRQCFYRGPESNCAVGCQLPDELYDKDMEGLGIEGVMNHFPDVCNYFGPENEILLSQLQSAHDTDFPRLKSRLTQIALEFNLSIPSAQ